MASPLDGILAECDKLCTMNASKAAPSITDVLRDAIVQSGISYKAHLAKRELPEPASSVS